MVRGWEAHGSSGGTVIEIEDALVENVVHPKTRGREHKRVLRRVRNLRKKTIVIQT